MVLTDYLMDPIYSETPVEICVTGRNLTVTANNVELGIECNIYGRVSTTGIKADKIIRYRVIIIALIGFP